ncbi:hypothetical protein [Acinetobacter indicus]|uniref:hypothetical protein n=1 Tax=Acinetobacter indicus TaxID=756892 RepID=UPI002E2F5017|nr:hypothetical protein [Acinetobacter indicus]
MAVDTAYRFLISLNQILKAKMVTQTNFLPTSEYICTQHDCQKIIVSTGNNEHLLICKNCYEENKNIQNIRHKFMSSLTKLRSLYYLLLFSLIYNFLTFVLDAYHSILAMNISIETMLKLFATTILIVFIEIELRKKLGSY